MATLPSRSVFSEDTAPNIYSRHIKDPIHGHIPISPKLTRFIDTMQFQRLRNVKQLGTTSWVWPGGSHTRFEHCLGVAFLARLTASHLQKNQPDLGITSRDIDCVEIAGLCHDLGHGPWSHVWDALFIPKALNGIKWTHEVASEMMFDSLIQENNVPIPKADQDFIKALIAGDPLRTPKEKAFLFEIVANKRNGLDVDKVDYIHRDSHMVGDPIRLSPIRLINSARVLDNQICYNIKDANQIYELCAARFKLHKIIYNHKAAKAIEYMIIDALLSADRYMKIAERIFDPKKYLYLTDDIMARVQSSEEPELEEARLIFNRIPKRDLYKCVDYKVIDWPHRHIFGDRITPGSIFRSAIALRTEPNTPDREYPEVGSRQGLVDTQELQESDIIVDFSTMHYGMKEKNPLDFVKFYSKLDMNRCLPATRGSYSNLMPTYFAEVLLRVYTKNPEHIEIVQDGYRAILRSLEDEFGLTMVDLIPDEVDVNRGVGMGRDEHLRREESVSAVPTPPETEAPTTPKMSTSRVHSRNASITMKGSGGMGGNTGPPSTPFSVNEFTTVAKKDAPGSPSRKGKGRLKELSKKEDGMRVSVSPSPREKRKRAEEHVEDDGKPKRRK